LLPSGKVLVVGSDPNLGSIPAELYDPANGNWTTTGDIGEQRSSHTATLLHNGKVLVVGGGGYFEVLASAKLYDPASGTWSPTGSLNFKRVGHTATLLPDGRVLVAGGGVDNFTGSVELYDPASGTWTATGSLITNRSGHTAELLPNGKVLVAGGLNAVYPAQHTFLASAELYDPVSGTWAPTGSMSAARRDHTSTLLPSGKVLVAAGFDYGRTLASAELYDPASGSWTTTGSLGSARGGHTATLIPNNKVLVAGGAFHGPLASAELYNPMSGTWTATGSLTTARTGFAAALLSTGKVLVTGGWNEHSSYFASAELYGKPLPTLLNISTRLRVLTGDKVLIGGFIIRGTDPKTVIVRGIGPSLPVSGALADPVIEVHGSAGELLAANDNWNEAATRQQIIESGLAPANDSESALWGVINPGTYTVILSGKNGGTGVGLVEVYDLNRTVDSELANISTRAFVDTGDNVMIGGLIVGGGIPADAATVIVRAVGPSLSASGVAGALGDPAVELHDGYGSTLAFNDNWKTRPDGSSQQAEIEATGLQPGNDLESAFVRTLPPGNYTAIVRGTNNTTGVGLVESYNLP
jgi:N-acetylneuraminic acid mutarotase